MPIYRLYRASELMNRLEAAKEYDADNDAAAIAIAEKCRARRAGELWQGNRALKEWKG
jgi:hypothetical protein